MSERHYVPGRGYFIGPIKRPPGAFSATGRTCTPLDMPETLLAELSRLFLAESRALERSALNAYTRSSWDHGATLEIASDGLRHDSHELAELASTKRRLRLNDRERNLMPWERRNPR